MHICKLLAVALITFFASSLYASEHWPAWRGPTGMGYTNEKNLPLTWDGKNQENILWKAPLFPTDKVRRDQNQSSPIVWGDRVFVTLSYWPEGTSEKEFPEHHVICYQVNDGRQRWDTTIRPGPWKLTDLRGGYTAPTPACDGQHVYVIFGSAVLAAIDFQGKIAWRRDITPHHFDVAWGASPVIYQDTVIVACDQLKDYRASTIYAFDGKTGALRWEKKRPAVDWGHSTPLVAKVGDSVQLLTATHHGPQGLDPATGKLLWHHQLSEQVGDTVTPIYRDGQLYIDSGRGSMGIAVDATGAGDVSKRPLKWKVTNVPDGFSSPVLVGEYLYRLHSPGVLTCREWNTGKEIFRERLAGADPSVSPIATADGRIYCASAGRSYVLKAGPTLEILARNEIGDSSRASPAVVGGRIFLKGGRFLYCIGAE